MHEQLLLFQDPPEIRMQREINALTEKYNKLRKGQYAKYSELKKLYVEAKEDIDFIKSSICKEGSKQMRMF